MTSWQQRTRSVRGRSSTVRRAVLLALALLAGPAAGAAMAETKHYVCNGFVPFSLETTSTSGDVTAYSSGTWSFEGAGINCAGKTSSGSPPVDYRWALDFRGNGIWTGTRHANVVWNCGLREVRHAERELFGDVRWSFEGVVVDAYARVKVTDLGGEFIATGWTPDGENAVITGALAAATSFQPLDPMCESYDGSYWQMTGFTVSIAEL